MENNMVSQEINEILKEGGIDGTQFGVKISSLTYISLICELERKFEIQFPDEVLTKNVFSDLAYLERLIIFLIDNKTI